MRRYCGSSENRKCIATPTDLTDGLLLTSAYRLLGPDPLPAGPVVESFEDKLELVAGGQAIAVLPTGDRRSTLRSDLATVPLEGAPTSKVVLVSRVGDPNPLVRGFQAAAQAHLTGKSA